MISSNIAPLEIIVKNSVRNLGVIINLTLSFDNQIKSVVKSSFYQLRMISRLKPILSFKDLETVIHAFITSRLDYCNSLYVGICQRHLSRLQIVQNASDRHEKKDHITPVLSSLHKLYHQSYRVPHRLRHWDQQINCYWQFLVPFMEHLWSWLPNCGIVFHFIFGRLHP